jgi:hypothetical protein
MPFDGTAIPANDTLWMPANIELPGFKSSSGATIYFTGQTVSYTANGTAYSFPVPNGSVTFSPTATTATTTFVGGAWSTTVPSNTSGKSFFAGIAIPLPAGLPGGVKPVTWSGQISSATHGVLVHWQWGGTVYTSFNIGTPIDYTQVSVKPVDDPNASVYKNSDKAGTPENFTQYATNGARDGGWSATGSCTT